MRQSYTLSAAPTTEPVTLAEAKSWAKIDADDDDSLVQQLITAARNSAEEYMRRSLITQTWKLTLDRTPNSLYNALGSGVFDMPLSALYDGISNCIELPRGPVQSVTSITTYDTTNTGTVFDSSNYFVDLAGWRVTLNSGCTWPTSVRLTAAVEVLYVTGYGASASSVPQPIKTGILIHIASMYEQRGQTDDAMDIPPGAKQLYNQFRVMGKR